MCHLQKNSEFWRSSEFREQEQHWLSHSDNHNCESRVIWSDEGGIFHLHKCHGINAVLLGVVDSLGSWGVNDEFNIYRVQVQVQVLYCVPVADAEVPPICPCCLFNGPFNCII